MAAEVMMLKPMPLATSMVMKVSLATMIVMVSVIVICCLLLLLLLLLALPVLMAAATLRVLEA